MVPLVLGVIVNVWLSPRYLVTGNDGLIVTPEAIPFGPTEIVYCGKASKVIAHVWLSVIPLILYITAAT